MSDDGQVHHAEFFARRRRISWCGMCGWLAAAAADDDNEDDGQMGCNCNRAGDGATRLFDN